MNLAILIGCSEYDDPEVGSLRYAAADAALFKRTLLASCPIAADNVLLLTSDSPKGQRPTRSNIIRLVRQAVAARRGALETVFLLFSGHGFRSDSTSADFLLPEDAAFSDLEDTGISIASLLHYIGDGLPRHVLFFIDACRNPVKGGRSIDQPAWDGPDMRRVGGDGVVVFASCAPSQRSYEVDALRSGIFTAAVCDGLSEEGQCKSVYELDHYLLSRVPELCKIHRRPQQTPYTRIEPLKLQSLVLVSESLAAHWQGNARLGEERRPKRITTRASIKRERPWCAIDFGTSHSVIAVLDDQRQVAYVPSPDERAFVPSVVCFEDDLSYSVGVEAIERARVQPANAVFAPKRLLGTNEHVQVAGRAIAPEVVVSLVLRSLRRNAEEFIGGALGLAIGSVPADFGIARANALARAFELAGLELWRLIGEPVAASVLLEEYARRETATQTLIVDLGGGTCDVSVVECDQNILEIVSVAGDNHLGGLDFDDAIVEYVRNKVHEKLPSGVVLSPLDEAALRRDAERAKHALSLRTEASVTLHNLELPGHGFTTIDVPIDRATLTDLTQPLIRRIDECVSIAFERASLSSRDDVAVVMLAGQGTKVFSVAHYMRQQFGDRVIDRYQESAVIRGLSEYLGVLESVDRELLILDSNYSTIGIACMNVDDPDAVTVSGDPLLNRSVFPLINAGTIIPFSTKPKTVSCREPKDGRCEITVVEFGTRETERFVVTSIPIALQPGSELVEIQLNVDANRTVSLAIRTPESNTWRVTQLNNHFKHSEPRMREFGEDWRQKLAEQTAQRYLDATNRG
jgi:molecular chaperone DnaK (HSP70)